MSFIVPVLTGIFGTVGSTVAGAVGGTAGVAAGTAAGAAAAGATLYAGTKLVSKGVKSVMPKPPKMPDMSKPEGFEAPKPPPELTPPNEDETRRKAIRSAFGSDLGGTLKTGGSGLLSSPKTSKKDLLGA